MAAQPPHAPVVIGELGRPHGVDGELRAYPTGPTLAAVPLGGEVTGRLRSGERVMLTLTGRRDVGDALILSFAQFPTREAAATAVGALLEVSAEALPHIDDPDEFYVRDLLGLTVTLAPGGMALGTVTRVNPGAANDSLEVTSTDGTVVLVPFTRDAIVDFDRTAGALSVRASLFGGDDA